MIGAPSVTLDQDQYQELLLNSELVVSYETEGQFYEGRKYPDGTRVVVANFGTGCALLYPGITTFSAFVKELEQFSAKSSENGGPADVCH